MDVLRGVIRLMAASKYHCKWYIEDLERLVFPPIELGQYRVFLRDGEIVGYLSWAFLTDEAARGYADGTRKLQPGDWNAGTDRWTIDFIAPFGSVLEIARVFRAINAELPPAKHIRLKREGFVCGRNGKLLYRNKRS